MVLITELQAQILDSAIQLDKLAWAINKLPESETRVEMVYKYDKTLERLSIMQYDLYNIDHKACYYGFTDNCSGIPCMECTKWILVKV